MRAVGLCAAGLRGHGWGCVLRGVAMGLCGGVAVRWVCGRRMGVRSVDVRAVCVGVRAGLSGRVAALAVWAVQDTEHTDRTQAHAQAQAGTHMQVQARAWADHQRDFQSAGRTEQTGKRDRQKETDSGEARRIKRRERERAPPSPLSHLPPAPPPGAAHTPATRVQASPACARGLRGVGEGCGEGCGEGRAGHSP